MGPKLYFCVIYLCIQVIYVNCSGLGPYEVPKKSSKFDNPNFVRDRFKIIGKPELPEEFVQALNAHYRPFHPSYMDYCAPYHCNAYHKTACGLNRDNMKFRWFQSGCHIVLNNMCSTYLGSLKYDMVDVKHCIAHVMYLRQGCEPCTDYSENPVCAMSSFDHHTEIFQNECALKTANCRPESLDEFDIVDMEHCVADVVFLRAGCEPCTDDEKREHNVCAMSVADFHVEMFPNECALKTANCKPETLDEYQRVEMEVCTLMKYLEYVPVNWAEWKKMKQREKEHSTTTPDPIPTHLQPHVKETETEHEISYI